MDDGTTAARRLMVTEQLVARGIRDERVLDAIDHVPRHLFVPGGYRHLAYLDRPLAIGHGQTISQPYIVARTLEALRLGGDERVLDVGTGSGYQAALLAELAREVYSVEIIPELAGSARALLRELGYQNVHVAHADGTLGYGPGAPYDAIAVAAAPHELPGELVRQLAAPGRMVIPVGPMGMQILLLVEKGTDGRVTVKDLGDVAFVPLIKAPRAAPPGELGEGPRS